MNDTEPAPLPCAEKLAFETVKAARATATVSEHRYGGKLKVYKCRHCHLYHLASDYESEV
ncbi:MAG TPA: hypothetical protein VLE99_01100 [Candidatus Saccharimonadales bacterium]|nr:hypothetical protein [Candidatus Saccharimonadales bacterium]